MTKSRGIAALFILITSTAWGASAPQFAVKRSQQDANGITLADGIRRHAD